MTSHQPVMNICSVGLQPFEDDFEGLLLGLLDGFILVLANDCKAYYGPSARNPVHLMRLDLPWGTPG